MLAKAQAKFHHGFNRQGPEPGRMTLLLRDPCLRRTPPGKLWKAVDLAAQAEEPFTVRSASPPPGRPTQYRVRRGQGGLVRRRQGLGGGPALRRLASASVVAECSRCRLLLRLGPPDAPAAAAPAASAPVQRASCSSCHHQYTGAGTASARSWRWPARLRPTHREDRAAWQRPAVRAYQGCRRQW